jgi:outer membrane receptor protein involved in Fe transport
MGFNRWIPASAAAVAAIAASGTVVQAQQTTGSIGGRVLGTNGEPLEAAQVQIVNTATGITTGTQTRGDGRFLVLGLELGNNYRVTVRRIGYAPQTIQPVRVSLGQTTPVNVNLATQATQLSTVTVEADAATSGALISPTRRGTETTISDTLIRKLPTLNRSFTDFVAITPQVSTNGPGLSAGGVSNRYNNIQIDGATERDLFGLGSTGQPGGQAGGKSIGIESVKEYQVLLAAYDVRLGNFAGASINAVTKSGTNDFTGSLYAYGRTEQLQRSRPYLNDYKQAQYGFTLGGPILKDRVFFFVNPEFQSRSTPAAGPALGDQNTRVTQALLDQFTGALTSRGFSDLGGSGRVNRQNPLKNIFARLDFVLPWNSTLVVRNNYASAEDQVFSRGTAGATPNFGLTSNLYQFQSEKWAPVAQLRTNFANGAYNEAILGYTRIRDARTTPGRLQPQVTTIVSNVASLIAGTDAPSQANQLDQDIFEFTNNFTLPLGTAHRLTLGGQAQTYKVRNLFGNNLAGSWTFGSIDSLVAGNPRQYQVGVPVSGDGAVRFTAGQFALYAQDDWTVSDRLNLSFGVRADVPVFFDKPPANPAVFTEFGRRTEEVPTGNLQFSPRFGFNWDVTGDQRNQVRGGAGMFQGAPAYVWLSNAFQNSGGVSGFATLTCTNAAAPRFTEANAFNPPQACANGTTARAGSEVNLLSKDLNFPQTFKVNIGYDRDLGAGFVGTVEALYSRGINGLFYSNIALAEPAAGNVGVDGRVLYGLQPQQPILRTGTTRNAVYDVRNQSKDYSYNLTGKLEKRFTTNFGGSVAYTWTQSFDVQSLTSSTAGSQFRFGRLYSGNQNEMTLEHSAWETPHRVVATGSYTVPRFGTSLSAIYTGQSGTRFAYTSNNDLNGDNQTANDPVYVPTDANDPRGPVFREYTRTVNGASQTVTVAQQQAAFFGLIESTDCLREAKGSILTRNACTSPWTNQIDISIEQPIKTFRGQNLSLRLDGINFANFLNQNWGRQISTSQFNPVTLYSPNAMVNRQTGANANLVTGVPRIEFNPDFQPFNYDNVFSNYTFQLSVRYSF